MKSFRLFLGSALVLFGLASLHLALQAGPVPANKPAAYPAWWFELDVIKRLPAFANQSPTDWLTHYPKADDYAVANVGQLKHIAKKAAEAMDSKLPLPGAGSAVHAVVDPWSLGHVDNTPPRDDFAAINIGQLKAVAKPFYDRLAEVAPTIGYPWASSTTPADDYALVNIGQVKNLFSFDPQSIVSSTLKFSYLIDPLFPVSDFTPTVNVVGEQLTLFYKESGSATTGNAWLLGSDDRVHWVTFNTRPEVASSASPGGATTTLSYSPIPKPGRRFVRLKFQQGELPRLAPYDGQATMTSPTSVKLTWTDPCGADLGYIVERFVAASNNWVYVAWLDPDTIDYLDSTATLQTGYTYRVKLIEDMPIYDGAGDPVYLEPLYSEPFSVKDTDQDGIPDALELGANYKGLPGTYATSPHTTDTDGDGLTDCWEIQNGLNPTFAADALADTDGDGVSNIDEYLGGTDPHDFFNNVKPTVVIESGDYQNGPAGQYLPEPIVATVYKPDGTPWANAPVTIQSTDSTGMYSPTNDPTSPGVANLTIRADGNGQVVVYWKVTSL